MKISLSMNLSLPMKIPYLYKFPYLGKFTTDVNSLPMKKSTDVVLAKVSLPLIGK